MEVGVLAALLAAVLLLALGVGALLMLKKADKEGMEQAQPRHKPAAEPEAEPEVAGGAARRRGAGDRMRAGQLRQRLAARVAEQAAAAAAAVVPAGGVGQGRLSDSDSGSANGSGAEDDDENLTAKERARKERREAREAERLAREARMGRKNVYEEKRAKKEADREAQERAQEEEIRHAEAERIAREDEEAAKWMGMISVETEGTGESAVLQEDQGLLGQFIDYIMAHKTVPLEQLAIEFGLRTSEVIDRVQGLEAMGRITGVMDERGKYIYISMEEMQAVASYIKTKGRVAISELAAQSNTFIDLEAKQQAAIAAGSQRAAAMDFDAVLGE